MKWILEPIFRVWNLGSLTSVGLRPLRSIRFPSVSLRAQYSGNSAVFDLSPCTHVGNSRKVSRRRSPQSRHLRICHRQRGDLLYMTGVMVHFSLGITNKNEVLIVWPGASHARIGVKLNPQVYSVQRQIPATFHSDRSTFWRAEDGQATWMGHGCLTKCFL